MKPTLTATLLLGLLVAAPGFADEAIVSRTGERIETKKPIEAYISPEHLFWHDNGLKMAEIYRPLPAFDKPEGTPIGKVVMTDSDCSIRPEGAAQPNEGCGENASYRFVANDGRAHDLLVAEFGYGESGLLTFRPIIESTRQVWAEIPYAGGKFWVKAPRKEIHLYEERAYLLGKFDAWCDKPGSCKPVSPKMRSEIAVLTPPAGGEQPSAEPRSWVASCYDEVYEIEERIVVEGKAYYRVKMAELEPGAPKVSLPRSGYVPTRGVDGSHTGYFYSRGC